MLMLPMLMLPMLMLPMLMLPMLMQSNGNAKQAGVESRPLRQQHVLTGAKLPDTLFLTLTRFCKEERQEKEKLCFD